MPQQDNPESLRLTSEDDAFDGVLADVEYAGAFRSCVVNTAVGNLRIEIASSAARPVKGERVRLAISENAVHLVQPA